MTAAPQIGSLEALREHYRQPAQRSLDKEVDHLDVHCRDFIAHAPFVVLATVSGEGRVDTSPKGGPPGFVAVLDDHTLAVPDMSGNNRLDSMSNIVTAGGASLLFLVPGTDETLRVVGNASLSVEVDVLDACPVDGMRPNVAIVLEVQTAYIHCAKALRRSGLWEPDRWPDTSTMATPACMLRDHVGLEATVEQTAAALDASYQATTWAMGGTGGPS